MHGVAWQVPVTKVVIDRDWLSSSWKF
jgi:hypothetical protein